MVEYLVEATESIIKLIANLDIILEYFVPGFCLVFVYINFKKTIADMRKT